MNLETKKAADSSAVRKLRQILNDKADLKHAPSFNIALDSLALESGLPGESVVDCLKKLQDESVITIGETWVKNPEWYDEQIFNLAYFNFVFQVSPFKRKGRQVQSDFLFTDFYQYNGGDEMFIVLWDVQKSKNENGEINCIECVEHTPNTGKLKIVVNEKYLSPLELNLKLFWNKFYELAGKQQTTMDKSFFDYFNSNPKNPIYTKFGYKEPSRILKFDGAVRIIPNIKIEIITDKKFKQRQNKTA